MSYLKSISELGPSQLAHERGATTDLTLVKHLSEGKLEQIPRAPRLLPARHQKAWEGLEEKKTESTTPPPTTPLHPSRA